MRVHHEEAVASHLGPEPCGGIREGDRTVGRGAHSAAIELRKKFSPGCRRVSDRGRQYGCSERPDGPAWSNTLACVDAPCTGTREPGGSRVQPATPWHHKDTRAHTLHSSEEADEQSRATGGRTGGAKDRGRGQCGPATRAGHRTGKACPRCWIAYEEARGKERRRISPRSSQHADAADGVLRAQARRRTGDRRPDMVDLRG